MNSLIQHIIIFTVAFAAATVGAMPLGLVNITVAKNSAINLKSRTKNIIYGATLIEVAFSIIAIITSVKLNSLANSNWQYLTIFILIISAIYFLKKKKNEASAESSYSSGFIQGVFLNLISLQVFIYWIFASNFLLSIDKVPVGINQLLIFTIGVVMGKILILKIYSKLGARVIQKSKYIKQNINTIMGVILILAAVIQFF